MDEKEIKKAASFHMVRCILVASVLMIGVHVLFRHVFFSFYSEGMKALAVAAAFGYAESIAVPKLWQWVASSHKNFLSTFHTAVSGFRMLLVLVVLGIVCIVVGRDAMVPYVVVLLAYYLVLLIMHTVFFAKMTHKLYNK